MYVSQGIPGIRYFLYLYNCPSNSGNLIYFNKFQILGKSTTPRNYGNFKTNLSSPNLTLMPPISQWGKTCENVHLSQNI